MPSNGTEMATNASGAPASEVILPEIVLWAVRVGAPMASPPRVNNNERIQRFMSPPHVAPGDAFEMATRNRAGEDSGCGDGGTRAAGMYTMSNTLDTICNTRTSFRLSHHIVRNCARSLPLDGRHCSRGYRRRLRCRLTGLL